MSNEEKKKVIRMFAMLGGLAALTEIAEDLNSQFQEEKEDLNYEPKFVGDKVRFIDQHHLLFYVHDANTKQSITPIDNGIPQFSDEVMEMLNREFVVVDTDLEYDFNCGMCKHLHRNDILIGDPVTRREYYVDSKHIALLNSEEK